MYGQDIKLSPDFIEQPRTNGWSIRAVFLKGKSLPYANPMDEVMENSILTIK